MTRALDRRGDDAGTWRRQEASIARKIGNLTRALADGYSPAITADLSQLEEQLADIREQSTASKPESLQLRMRDTRRFVESRLTDLRRLFSAEAVTIRAEIAKHVQKITLTPEGRTYVASGAWDLLGAWQHGWCRRRGLHIAVPGSNSKSRWPRDHLDPFKLPGRYKAIAAGVSRRSRRVVFAAGIANRAARRKPRGSTRHTSRSDTRGTIPQCRRLH